MDHAAWQARACRLLAIPLHQPGDEDWAMICSGEWGHHLSHTLRAMGIEVQDVPVPGRLQADARADYERTFTGAAPVRPIESLYKEWTSDPTAELPLARETGWLGGDAAAHLRALYQSLGIIVPPELHHAPDHLALELEFLALLLEANLTEQADRFRVQHLNWLPALYDEAVAKEAPVFYRDLFALVDRVVRAGR